MSNLYTLFSIEFYQALILKILGYFFFLFPLLLPGQSGGGVTYTKKKVYDLPYTFSLYGAQQNLPQSQVASIMKDVESGKIILSTAYGLSSFDGKMISEFRSHPYYGRMIFTKFIRSNRIREALGFNSANQLVILSNQPKILGRFSDVDISKDHWATIDFNGVIQSSEGGNYSIQNTYDTGIKNALFLKRMKTEQFLVSGATGSVIFDLKTQKKVWLTKDIFKASIYSPAHNAHLLISSDAIYALDDGFTLRLVYKSGQDCQFSNIEYVNGKIVITSLTGLYMLEGTDLKHFTQSDNFPTDVLVSIFYDSTTECIFLGSGNKGLLKLQPKRFSTMYGESYGITGASGAMYPDAPGSFWFTNRTAIYRMNGGVYEEIVDTKNVNNALYFSNDTIFSSLSGSIIHYKSLITNKIGLLGNVLPAYINIFYKDISGSIWVGTKQGVYKGLNLFDLKPYLPMTISKAVSKIFEAKSGEKFLGGFDGLYILDRENHVSAFYGKESGFTKNGIRSFLEDKEGNVWIGTYGNGLFCYTEGELISLNKRPNCMIGNDIFSLARDRNGYILMSSNSGMRIVHEQALLDYIHGKLDYLIPYVFGEQDGIINPEFNGGFQYNFATTDSLTFYFPSIQGLVSYYAKPFSNAFHHLALKTVKTDNLLLKKGEKVSRNTKFLTFIFDDIDFNTFENVHYQYRIVQNNTAQDWSNVRTSTEVTIDYPEAGSYRIDFRRLDARNLVSPVQVSHTFYVNPYFYETGWFILLALIGMVTLIASILWIYLDRRQQILQRELDSRNTITELQLSSIQAQMNPHFMFNALNVLVHMINLAPKKKAEQFAISFARLMRKVLEHSKKSFVSIEEEIDTLEDYLFIQKQRLGANFQYEIYCPDSLGKIQIPTMIIQPLVENAIIHGVAQVDYPGNISIKFSGHAPYWQVDISDNGIGIKNTTKRDHLKNKTSFGIALVQKKLELLKSRYDIIIDLTFSEKDPATGAGTLVTIKRLQI